MKKVKKTFKALVKIIKNPWLLNLVIDNNEDWYKKLKKSNYTFSELPVLELSQLINIEEITVDPYLFLGGGCIPTDIALLKGLSKEIENCKYFEIGTWRGESVSNVAKYASECFTLNLSSEELKKLKLSQDYIDQIGMLSLDKINIKHLKENSLTFDFSSLNKKFDLIFIDGEHHYDFIKSDTKNVFKHLVHDNSIIVWHDYAKNPEKVRYEVLAAILDGTEKELHKNIYHVENTLCAIYINKSFTTSKLEKVTKPRHSFSINLEKKYLEK